MRGCGFALPYVRACKAAGLGGGCHTVHSLYRLTRRLLRPSHLSLKRLPSLPSPQPLCPPHHLPPPSSLPLPPCLPPTPPRPRSPEPASGGAPPSWPSPVRLAPAAPAESMRQSHRRTSCPRRPSPRTTELPTLLPPPPPPPLSTRFPRSPRPLPGLLLRLPRPRGSHADYGGLLAPNH